ncbi:hypothetical protein AMTRI_Chr10g3000 [Amborella trichopoda]
MLVLSWNARGLGGMQKRRMPQRLILLCRPNVLDLQETKLALVDIPLLRTFWNSGPLDFAFSPYFGLSGGLLMLWDPLFYWGIFWIGTFDVSLLYFLFLMIWLGAYLMFMN